ncbi:hypothetical protein PZH37_18545, partial [[Eubacterium] siraeum]|nr:hypothetical protein [[Eubacterium] siraeum]
QYAVSRACASTGSPFDFDVNALQDLFPTQQTESLDESYPINPEFALNTSVGTDLKNQLRQLKLLISDFLHLLQGMKR